MNLQFQRYKELWVAGIIMAVVGLLLAVLAIRSRATFIDARDRLQNAQSSIERLQRAQPYPSRENVAMASGNVTQLRDFRNTLLEAMSQNQFEPLNVEPAAFPLGPALVRLRAAARQNTVTLKEGEAFGFQRYVADGVPASATNEIGRLTVQLQLIEHVCRVLFGSGISELTAVNRMEFEAPGRQETPRGRGARRQVEPVAFDLVQVDSTEEEEEDGLFRQERLQIEFRCEAPVVWRVLNVFAADPSFIVVRDIKVESDAVAAEAGEPRAAARPADGAQPTTGPVPHHERIVAGRERVNVTLTLDAYRFLWPDQEADEQQEGGYGDG